MRDSLLGREPGDYDVATSARPDEVKNLFKRTLNVGAAFGVMIVLGNKQQGQVEVATFRADGEYLDGRRPKDVTFWSCVFYRASAGHALAHPIIGCTVEWEAPFSS